MVPVRQPQLDVLGHVLLTVVKIQMEIRRVQAVHPPHRQQTFYVLAGRQSV